MKQPLNIVRDTREQKRQDRALGWTFSDGFDPKPTLITDSLSTGDYSLVGHENEVVVERKTLPDLIACLGPERERFERELSRMRGIPSVTVIVESPQSAMERGRYRSRLLPEAAWQSIISFTQKYRVPFIFCRNARAAERACFDFLRHYAIHFWKKARAIERAAGKCGGA